MTWPHSEKLAFTPPISRASAMDSSSFSEMLRRQAPHLLPAGSAVGSDGVPTPSNALPHGTTIVALKFPGGVLIADYLLVKRARIDLVALFEPKGPYWYWNGVNPVAVVWTVLGFLAYMFVIPAEWIRVVVTLLATGAGYWASILLLAPHLESFVDVNGKESLRITEDGIAATARKRRA